MIGEMIAADIGLVHHLSGVGLLAEERRPRATTTRLAARLYVSLSSFMTSSRS